MEEHALDHLYDLYGLGAGAPHVAFQFPRLPPNRAHPMLGAHGNPMREEFARQASSIGGRLNGFQEMYRQHAAGLLSMSQGIVPPGHPLYDRRGSAEALRAENDKLLKENAELKKRLESKESGQHG